MFSSDKQPYTNEHKNFSNEYWIKFNPCVLIYPKTRLNLRLKVIVYCYDKVEDPANVFWLNISKFTKPSHHPSSCVIIDSKCYLNREFTRRIIRPVTRMSLQLQPPKSASKLQLQPPTSKCILTHWRLRAVTHECQICTGNHPVPAAIAAYLLAPAIQRNKGGIGAQNRNGKGFLTPSLSCLLFQGCARATKRLERNTLRRAISEKKRVSHAQVHSKQEIHGDENQLVCKPGRRWANGTMLSGTISMSPSRVLS